MAFRLHRPTLLTGNLKRSFGLYCDILGFEVCFIKEKSGQDTPAYKYFNINSNLYEITNFATLDLLEPLPSPSPLPLTTTSTKIDDESIMENMVGNMENSEGRNLEEKKMGENQIENTHQNQNQSQRQSPIENKDENKNKEKIDYQTEEIRYRQRQQRVLGLIEVRKRLRQEAENGNEEEHKEEGESSLQLYSVNQIRVCSIVVQVENVQNMYDLLTEKGYETFEPEPPTPTPEGRFYREMSFLDDDGHLVVLYHLQ